MFIATAFCSQTTLTYLIRTSLQYIYNFLSIIYTHFLFIIFIYKWIHFGCTFKLGHKFQLKHLLIFALNFPDDIPEDNEVAQAESVKKDLLKEEPNTRETSPLKETLLNRFSSKFSSNSGGQQNFASINNGDLAPISVTNSDKSSPDHDLEQTKSSWLHTVKGKIAKTVEEKYTEYKNEKEMRKLQVGLIKLVPHGHSVILDKFNAHFLNRY